MSPLFLYLYLLTNQKLIKKIISKTQMNKGNVQNVPKPPRGNILFVSNICSSLNYEQIKEGLYALFSIHGPIFDITIKTKENGKHFAFVDFPNIEDADKALEASQQQGKILQGKQLLVNYCQDPKKNEARKRQKCFICHSEGHKAKNCTVRPDLIKMKPKQTLKEFKEEQNQKMSESSSNESQTNDIEKGQGVYESSNESEQQIRDPDYLRFLKMKKRLLENKFLERMGCRKRKK